MSLFLLSDKFYKSLRATEVVSDSILSLKGYDMSADQPIEVPPAFPLKSLKYLFVHIPDKKIESSVVTKDFVDELSYAATADFEDIYRQANISYVTDSDAGDVVKQTGKVPDWVFNQIESFYPELSDNKKQPHQYIMRVFNSGIEGRYGLIILAYDLIAALAALNENRDRH